MFALASFAAHADAKTDALIKAAANNNIAKAKRLIAAGANVNSRNENDSTALMYADSPDMAELLLAAGAVVDAKQERGWTALMFAAERNSSDVARLLIAAGADLDAKNEDGFTALVLFQDHARACVVPWRVRPALLAACALECNTPARNVL